ncbi:RNB-domain-containing protein [Lentinula edodes]|uniref:RNB-domain-containing protein n=1 Tax=Lentinula edodes TaxID=5353 RepID=A0A1Q3DYC5_LENED|nr:RNB-domain-containing protein [Lentinula edodes]
MVEITIRKRPQTEAVITQRKFFKKTARGKVVKVLRERYLRDDVACGIEGCRECSTELSRLLPPSGGLEHRLFPNGHYILPDTNVFLAQMDLIESSLFNPPMILLQTVLEEVRHRSLPLYNRLKALTKSEDKQIWVFYNEYRSQRNCHIFPEKDWKAPADEVVDQEAIQKNDDAEDSGEEGDENDEEVFSKESRVLSGSSNQKPPSERQPTGRIVGIIKRNWRAYVCHIDSTSIEHSHSNHIPLHSTVLCTPRILACSPEFAYWTVSAPDSPGYSKIFSYDVDRGTPFFGYSRRTLREGQEAEQESLLLEFEVPYRPFGKAILDCLPPEGEQWVVPPKGEFDLQNIWRDREDLRDVIVCSIDPPGCQDIDDALHAKLLPNGNIEAGVHIADVSHFVLPDNPMDSEAAARGTTVYLVDNRIDMLPSLLGTNLCSLRPFVERLAFSSIWELTADAEIVSVRFTKSVIKSKAAFTYEEAQIRKDDPNLHDKLTNSIRLLNTLAIKLKAKRMAAGALNLASPEVKIHLDSAESSDPIDVEQKELRETNSLVEEFMLLANISVARKIEESFPQTAVLRRHLPPPKTNFEKLQDILRKTKGFSLDVSSSGALAASLDECVDAREPAFNTLCGEGYLRYADVLVHRQLSAAIGSTPLHATLHSKSHVERVLDVVNRRHRMAQMAGRASVEFYVGLALKARGEQARARGEPDVREDAYVIRTFRNGVGVFVSKLGIEGLVTFKRDTQFDAENYTITVPGAKEEVKISVFDKVVVRIEVEKDKNTQRGKVKMTLVEPVDSSAF